MHTRSIAVAALSAAILVTGRPAEAQTGEPSELSAEAAQEPPGSADDSVIDTLERFAEEIQIVERLNGEIDGWYPRLGGMTTGSGFALGPGYRTHLFDDRLFVDVSAGLSKRNYKAADVNVRWLQILDDRVELWTDFRYQDFPQEDFFGLGVDSSLDRRTDFALTSTGVTVRGIVHARPWLRVGADLGHFNPDIGPGTDDRYPATQDLFADEEAPGLAAQPDFLHTTFYTEVDYRDEPGNARRGGFYRLAFGIWDDRTLQQFDFRRLDGEAAQFVPVAGADHVLAGRVGFSYVNNEAGERVPFYFLAYVGGADTLRGYREFRFKDENALWINAEYRWAVHDWVDVALFADAGEVRADWEQIDLKDLRTSYGAGIRINSDSRVFVRLDVGAGGGEGRQIFFKLGESF
jgi:outer membrane protein assembly factor BamA